MSETLRQLTQSTIERISKHDDLYPHHVESFVGSLVARSLPSLFDSLLDTYPTVTQEMDYEAYGKSVIAHKYTLTFDIYTDTERLDLNVFRTDKDAFYDTLTAYVERVSKRLLDLKSSGCPVWKNSFNPRVRSNKVEHHSFIAPSKHPTENTFYPWHETLGQVKQRGGKWVWYLFTAKHRADWPVNENTRPVEGKCNTVEDAKAVIDKIWKESHETKPTV
jgi:hypothetical protein